jgi:replicative superfamily II helicase
MFFEDFLHKNEKSEMSMASKEDIHAFYNSMKDQNKDVNNYLRAISLYYKFKSKPELSALASELRQQKIASERRPYPLKGFREVNPEHVSKLATINVKYAEQMLELGRTQIGRQRLSDKTGMPVETILEFVKLSDLSRIERVKNIRARLYYDAGIDTAEKIAKWNPEDLRTYLVEFVKKTGFKGIAPLPKEAKHRLRQQRDYPKLYNIKI